MVYWWEINDFLCYVCLVYLRDVLFVRFLLVFDVFKDYINVEYVIYVCVLLY